MSTSIFVPGSLLIAGRELRQGFAANLEELPNADFVRAWCVVAYIFPGLHPDGYDEPGSGWPRVLIRFPAEAWRRNDIGELLDEEMYPSDAQWSGIYDRLEITTAEENRRRVEIALKYGMLPNA